MSTLNKPLDRALAEQMASAVHTINSIVHHDGTRKPEPDDEIKLKGMSHFLSNAFLEHASEFLGAWLAVCYEYEPLVKSFAALQARATAMNQVREKGEA